MHITFQFPIVDLRSLLDNSYRLLVPSWPTPDTSSQGFLRNFGGLQERTSNVATIFSGEGVFCNARSAIRYPDLDKQCIPIGDDMKATIRSVNRRFFSDGRFLNKVETSFVDTSEAVLANKSAAISADSVLKHYANLQVRVKSTADAGKQTKLYKAGKPLSQLYCTSSTFHSKFADELCNYVASGQPCIMAIAWEHSPVQLPANAVEITETDLVADGVEIKLYGYKLKHEGAFIKTWIALVPKNEVYSSGLSPAVAGLLRVLRINLMRIHAEKETIRILLRNISNKAIALQKGSEKAEAIERYLKNVSEKLFKKKRYEINQANIIEFALASEETTSADNSVALQEGISYFTDQFVTKNLNQIVYQMGDTYNITGSNNQTIVRSEIHDSFNVISQHHGPAVVKALELLEKEVTKAGDKDAQESVKVMAKELEKKEPNKSLLKTIWGGIVAAVPTVKTISEIAAVITGLF